MLNKKNLLKLSEDISICAWNFIDSLLPNLTLFLSIRGRLFNLFWKTGNNLILRKGNRVRYLKNLLIGSNVYLNESNLFDNKSVVRIGDFCLIGFRNIFLTANHVEKGKQKREELQYSRQIIIGNNVWITSNCTILPGTVIEDNVILSAGSVASGILKSGWIYRGNPAVKVRKTKGVVR